MLKQSSLALWRSSLAPLVICWFSGIKGNCLSEEDLLRTPPAQNGAEDIQQVGLGLLLALARKVLRKPEGALGARDDCELQDRVAALQEPANHGMARLVDGDDPALLVADNSLLLKARDDSLGGAFEVFVCDTLLVLSRGQNRGFVAQVGDVRAGKAWRERREPVGVLLDRLRRVQEQLLQVYLENLLPSFQIR